MTDLHSTWVDPEPHSAASVLKRQGVTMSEPPEGTRLILASETILEKWGTRTEDGYRIRATWGSPDENGWYTPTFTVDYNDRLNVVEHAPDLGDD